MKGRDVQYASTVWAPWPAARPAHAFMHLIHADSDAAFSGGILLGRGDPTNPFVARQRGEIRPETFDGIVQFDRLSEIRRQLVNRAICKFLRGHTSKCAGYA